MKKKAIKKKNNKRGQRKEKVTFLIPALNEEEAITDTIKSINDIDIKLEYEIVIIDGGSKDRTVELAKKAGAKVIPSKKGYGRQYKKGLRIIDTDYVITGDADCTYPFDKAYRILDKWIIGKGYEFITTNRFAKLHKGSMSWDHHLGNLGLTWTTNLLFWIPIKDSQSGMWIFRKKAQEKLRLVDNDMAFSEEIKIEAFRRLKKVKELPISYYKRVGDSKLNYGHAFKNMLFLFLRRFGLV